MYDDPKSEPDQPEAAQKFLYHASGKLYRYLAKFAGENPDEVERAVHDSLGEVTAGADPVLIGDALGGGIDLGFSLAERRRALQRYHDEVVRREIAPPAYDTEQVETDDGEMAGFRVLVSEPDCRFFTSSGDDPTLLVHTPDGGKVEVPLAFEPGSVEPIDTGGTVSEVIVRPVGWSFAETTVEDSKPPQQEGASEDATEQDYDALEETHLDIAREIVLEDPGRALLANEEDDSSLGRLVAKLLEREPSVPVEAAPDIIHEAIRRVGLDALEERYDELMVGDSTEADRGDDPDADDGTTADGGNGDDEEDE